MLLMIDNYDSFTYNIVQYLAELGQDVEVYRNDEIDLEEIREKGPERIVISPGPCTPNEAGISMDVIRRFGEEIPILGICLGHQSIGQVFGADIVKAKRVMHGKTSSIHHDGEGIFAGLASPFTATRYHSLVIDPGTVPAEFEISAWTVNEQGAMDEVMGVRHKTQDLEGVQFHPESILTQYGHELLANFLQIPVKTPL
ncbi:MAG: aminodeoxychorismate/anthranilate synthase component II [Proteobacteria bacterium]|nr:aminodeoxychorismate/anthranilate synthase component II [Pseudomonadota bacterium]